MMDGDPPGIFIGYYRWHTIVRTMSLIILEDNKKEKDTEMNAGLLLQLDRNIGLAWAIQKKMMPMQDDDITDTNPGKNPNNQGIDFALSNTNTPHRYYLICGCIFFISSVKILHVPYEALD
jgi:hypothetical protein